MVSNTRDTLLAAAAQLLDEGGPEAVTLREVGHRAGVSHNAPYKHFADKQALLAAVAARELDRSSSALSPTVGAPRPPEAAVQAAIRGDPARGPPVPPALQPAPRPLAPSPAEPPRPPGSGPPPAPPPRP